jgi:hypothetical protein
MPLTNFVLSWTIRTVQRRVMVRLEQLWTTEEAEVKVGSTLPVGKRVIIEETATKFELEQSRRVLPDHIHDTFSNKHITSEHIANNISSSQ